MEQFNVGVVLASNFVLRFTVTDKHKHVFETSLKTFFKDIIRVYSLILNESEVINILKNWDKYLPDVERSIVNNYDLSLDVNIFNQQDSVIVEVKEVVQ